ncbi:hypothetical protein OBBRIDRAFT_801382 [Obba rivulosa]|uniref:Uncharacterized protein n=1 Tax=Obba rivulosa TaxID=1052685 RepID=A0A8E2J419_9APHY|nr:hypothetical protein OBBRIDRAFT_801382 [Obba rivulosa]
MPSLTAVVFAIVGGCILVTILLSYTIWSIRHDQAEIQRQWRSHQRTDRYTHQHLERNQRRAQRVNPVFAMPVQDFGEQKECLLPVCDNKNLADVHISEELEMVELAEKVVREFEAR